MFSGNLLYQHTASFIRSYAVVDFILLWIDLILGLRRIVLSTY